NQISDKTNDTRVRLADMEIPIRNLPREAAARYDLADWTLPSALIIGSEADGPSEPARALAAETVFIPMPGGTESLNAAMAGTIVLFEAVRQRGAMREAYR
ncbi:MAG TPA: TrmH family RNA methyltransferase, partial [Anaerolineae bacterium]